jgi:DNA-binding response OmpR family regulator/HPt (histidine-containing phosphotransfer) domain-containing protein
LGIPSNHGPIKEGTVKVRVAAATDWLPGLDARFGPDTELVRSEAVTDAVDADVLVVPMANAASMLSAVGEDLTAPVVWVVPKEARRSQLQRLSDACPACRFVFETDPDTVAEACREVVEERAAAERQEADREAAQEAAGASMAALWKQFRGTMLERLEVLESVGVDVLEGDAAEDRLEDAHHAAHKLHGSLGTFGLRQGSELASELEELIEGGLEAGLLAAGDRYRYSELVVGLRREIEAGRPAASAEEADGGSPVPEQAVGAILIIDSDPDRLEKLRAAAVARGWAPSPGETAGAALEWLEDAAPVLAVLDPAAGEPATLEALLEALAEGPDPVPVVFQGRTRTLDERLQAVTLGARVFVDREATPDAVMGRAESLLEAERPGDALVLAVDDDPSVLRVLTFILRGAGFGVRTLSSPLEFWGTLEAVEPDLVLLDVQMPEVNGYQLCRAVRADPRWSELPILFLTARSDPSDVIAGFEAGGDDFVVKPVAGPELLARIENRLARLGSEAGEVEDRETGLPSRAAARERLETQVAVAGRYQERVTVALIRLEGSDRAALDREVAGLAGRLRKEARAEDIVARWAQHEVMVSRYDEDAGATHRWLERHLPTDAVGVVIGMATHPEEGGPEALLERAAADLTAEGSRGDPTASVEAGTVDADIVVVEDDEALGTLLRQTLDERGYNTHWIRDGAEAAELLTGEEPAMRASLIVLDVGLPGMDGLSLLRKLARDGITRRTRVLMLTARSAESEVVKALELGAFDHVPKPFSVSELIHRVKRALGERGSQ